MKFFVTFLFLVAIAVSVDALKPGDGLDSLEDSKKCDTCKAVVEKVAECVAKNETQAQIENVLKIVCHQIPSIKYKNWCEAIVVKYVPEIIALLEKYDTPEDVCKQLGLCFTIFFLRTPNGTNTPLVVTPILA